MTMMRDMIKKIGTFRMLLRYTLLLLMLTTGIGTAWGDGDLSGTYFIANGNGYSNSNAANNFYLVPATNSFYASDDNQPHLTTQKTGQVLNCCWRIEKSGDYYRIIHVADGKYLTANPAYSGTTDNNVGRLRVHLETMGEPDDNTLFEIKSNNNGGYNIRHKDMADKINNSTTTYLDPAGGNVDDSNLTNSRTMSTSSGTVNVGGGIGYWSDEPAARWYFEEVPQNNTYTYNIVDGSGRIAIKYTTAANQPAAKALRDYNDIPEAIRSPYISDETISFYSFSGDFSTDKLSDENSITSTPMADGANIYVTYTTDNLEEKFLKLRGVRSFNIKVGGNYIYDSGTTGSGTLAQEATAENYTTPSRLWMIGGGDPYAVEIKNLATNNYLVFSTPPTLSIAATATNKFILMAGSAAGDGTTYEQLKLMAVTGTGDMNDSKAEVQFYPVGKSTTYYLIDRAGKLIANDILSESSALGLPDDWKSPLVPKYYYFKTATISGDIYTLSDPVSSPFDATDGIIYVNYDVNDDIDIDGRNSLNIAGKENKTYMLRYLNGESFYQENGEDDVMDGRDTREAERRKAVYPYSNGDAALYVYGDEQWQAQLANGASTRSRWLWIIEPANNPSTKAELDPYHVKISSYQTQTSYTWEEGGVEKTRNFHSYLRTYQPDGYDKIVTGVTNDNPLTTGGTEDAAANNSLATEYMIVGTMSQSRLVTLNPVPLDADHDGTSESNVRRTVNSFEMYWKNNPTIQGDPSHLPMPIQGVLSGNKVETVGRNVHLNASQKSAIETHEDYGWHVYEEWANSAPWVNNDDAVAAHTDPVTGEEVPAKAATTSKKFMKEEHVFQTINMGSTGDFVFEPVTLAAQVILLDKHGWEIMRVPINDTETLKKYDSPMVKENGYHWYPSAVKATGYHKYTITDPAPKIKIYTTSTEYTEESYSSSSLADTPEEKLTGYSDQNNKYKTDFYVTYDVTDEYADAYTGAATAAETMASVYLLKQDGKYATAASNTEIGSTTVRAEDNVDMQWYVKPNFNIDEEMGYVYKGEAGATDDAKRKNEAEAEYFAAGKNGFDPYNVQIQSMKHLQRFFTANTSGSKVDGGVWKGTSSTVNLANMKSRQAPAGNDQTKLKVTNATFMIVDDGSGNMLLMPRFDNNKVMQVFNTLAEPSGASTQKLELEKITIIKEEEIHSRSEITTMNGHYLLASDFDFSDFTSLGSSSEPFTGIIDGQLNTLKGLTVPLVAYAQNATIKNVILEDVNIGSGNSDGDAGAIACKATGSTRIYNCGILASTVLKEDGDDPDKITGFSGSSVTGTRHVGSLVGLLEGTSRVINCYSYANVNGGTNVGGIVGNNNYNATKASDIRTMVMNCMFYGDLKSGTNKSPVYGGNNINNLQGGLNTFNYYSYNQLPTSHISSGKYNCALAVEEKYLNRHEFYRLLLNSNKKLAAFYVTGNPVDADQMAKWVLETADRTIENPKPYPVLKAQGNYYPSIINPDFENAPDSASVGRNHGGKLGRKTLTVNISSTKTGGGQSWPEGATITTPSLDLTRTDKDFDRFNYNYDKVQLPYYNEVGTGNYTGNRVVTGWKITAITAVTGDPYSSSNYPTSGITDFSYHNYADRKSSKKDTYTVSKRVFSQGAYFDVPYGVTSITIEPYWAKAAYVADANYDVVYKNDYTGKQNVSATGTQVTGTTEFNGQKVETSVSNAITDFGGFSSNPTVYDYAVVLVGNFHLDGVPSGDSNPFTMMSVDEDNDNEPDYSLIYHHKGRTKIAPIRFDFLNIVGTAQAQKPNGASSVCNFTIFKTQGWFETTNTSLFYTSQLEYENLDGVTKSDAPLILLGGVVDQFVSTQSKAVTGKTIYIHVGGNIWINSFGLGTHSDGSQSTPHVPVSVTGGEFPGFYLTGTYNANAAERTDNAECYISGGYFHEAAGASQEGINGSVHWQIYNADIDNFFGGGTNDAKPIKGDITVDIFNSHVGTYCGGPKFGNMQPQKKVTTHAEGCVFGTYFGAGFGGLSYSRKKYYDNTSPAWGTTLQGYYTTDRGKYFDGATTNSKNGGGNDNQYGKKGPGVATDFDYEFFVWSSGSTGGRFFVKFASFSLAQCNEVESKLKNCIIENNYYGGGSLGKVVGAVTSELDGCTVKGNVFGAGYSASVPTLEVRNAGFTTNPNYNKDSGMFEPGVFSGTTTFHWDNGSFPNNGTLDPKFSSGKVTTNINLETSNLGSVDGNVSLTLMGNTKVGTLEGGSLKAGTGNVFGGGESSYVTSTSAAHTVTVTLQGNTEVYGNVFGGGDQGNVQGSTTVNVE